jgi:hypothetical protein
MEVSASGGKAGWRGEAGALLEVIGCEIVDGIVDASRADSTVNTDRADRTDSSGSGSANGGSTSDPGREIAVRILVGLILSRGGRDERSDG